MLKKQSTCLVALALLSTPLSNAAFGCWFGRGSSASRPTEFDLSTYTPGQNDPENVPLRNEGAAEKADEVEASPRGGCSIKTKIYLAVAGAAAVAAGGTVGTLYATGVLGGDNDNAEGAPGNNTALGTTTLSPETLHANITTLCAAGTALATHCFKSVGTAYGLFNTGGENTLTPVQTFSDLADTDSGRNLVDSRGRPIGKCENEALAFPQGVPEVDSNPSLVRACEDVLQTAPKNPTPTPATRSTRAAIPKAQEVKAPPVAHMSKQQSNAQPEAAEVKSVKRSEEEADAKNASLTVGNVTFDPSTPCSTVLQRFPTGENVRFFDAYNRPLSMHFQPSGTWQLTPEGQVLADLHGGGVLLTKIDGTSAGPFELDCLQGVALRNTPEEIWQFYNTKANQVLDALTSQSTCSEILNALPPVIQTAKREIVQTNIFTTQRDSNGNLWPVANLNPRSRKVRLKLSNGHYTAELTADCWVWLEQQGQWYNSYQQQKQAGMRPMQSGQGWYAEPQQWQPHQQHPAFRGSLRKDLGNPANGQEANAQGTQAQQPHAPTIRLFGQAVTLSGSLKKADHRVLEAFGSPSAWSVGKPSGPSIAGGHFMSQTWDAWQHSGIQKQPEGTPLLKSWGDGTVSLIYRDLANGQLYSPRLQLNDKGGLTIKRSEGGNIVVGAQKIKKMQAEIDAFGPERARPAPSDVASFGSDLDVLQRAVDQDNNSYSQTHGGN